MIGPGIYRTSVVENNYPKRFWSIYDSGLASDTSVRYLLRGEGADGGTVFNDVSTYNISISGIGNAQTSTAQSKFGTSSILLDGSGDYLAMPTDSSFLIGSQDFTWECWFRLSGTNFGTLFSLIAGGQYVIAYAWYQGIAISTPDGYTAGASTTISQNVWHYFGVSRSGATLTAKLNGVTEVNKTVSFDIASSISTHRIGRDNATNDFQGNLDEIRFTVGQTRDITTIPTAAFPTP